MPTLMSDVEWGLFRSCYDDPLFRDWTPRLIYADWLEEHHHRPHLAQLIRIAHELRTRPREPHAKSLTRCDVLRGERVAILRGHYAECLPPPFTPHLRWCLSTGVPTYLDNQGFHWAVIVSAPPAVHRQHYLDFRRLMVHSLTYYGTPLLQPPHAAYIEKHCTRITKVRSQARLRLEPLRHELRLWFGFPRPGHSGYIMRYGVITVAEPTRLLLTAATKAPDTAWCFPASDCEDDRLTTPELYSYQAVWNDQPDRALYGATLTANRAASSQQL
jgi:uncharacterized protein (TIGR02996 family)